MSDFKNRTAIRKSFNASSLTFIISQVMFIGPAMYIGYFNSENPNFGFWELLLFLEHPFALLSVLAGLYVYKDIKQKS